MIDVLKQDDTKELIDNQSILDGLDLDRLPKHIAIIMDGNGRWAQERGLARGQGHKAGVEAVRRTIRAIDDLNIGYMTLYSFSSENWSRPKLEIISLFNLLREFITSDLHELQKNNVRIRIIGEEQHVPKDILSLLLKVVNSTQENTGLQLVIAFNYGSRMELTQAFRALATQVKEDKIQPDDINEDLIQAHLYTNDIPDPDLIIRTSGEQRLSNFLLWQAAYSEFYYEQTYWPEFNKEKLHQALYSYLTRKRRYGGVVETEDTHD